MNGKEQVLLALKNAKGYSTYSGVLDQKLKTKHIHFTYGKEYHNYFETIDKDGMGVKVKFNKKRHYTIFENALLYSLFVLKKRPTDYAHYFKCQAGSDFLDSIMEIWIAEKTIEINWRLL